MNAVRFENNHYVNYEGAKLYVDYANNRIKIIDYPGIADSLIREIIEFAKQEGIGKIITNCRIPLLKPFKDAGFKVEGLINGFFCGEDAYCVSYFVDNSRSISRYHEEEDTIISKCTNNQSKFVPGLDTSFTIRNATVNDIPQMIKLFSEVFKTYPSPVFSLEYLKKVMNDKVLFKVVTCDEIVISVASADIDTVNFNAEITDCATYPEYRGKGLLSNLIYSLEEDLKQRGFFTLYSLSRAINPGINFSLSKLNYRYSGRLVNNCHICGCFEDMNIWIKQLKT